MGEADWAILLMQYSTSNEYFIANSTDKHGVIHNLRVTNSLAIAFSTVLWSSAKDCV